VADCRCATLLFLNFRRISEHKVAGGQTDVCEKTHLQRIVVATFPAMLAVGLLVGCPAAPTSPDGGKSNEEDGGARVAGMALFGRMAGLWGGQAAQTPLGSFPEMYMDFRAADSEWLFGRVDLNATNSLRYGFAIEDIAGQPTVVYRNGGFFQATLRDLTTQLVDFDDTAGTYHFCAGEQICMYVNGTCVPEQGGCGFVDALFTFNAPDQMVFNAHVNGQEHLIWTTTRKETRTLPAPFPDDTSPVAADAGWPAMPQLSVRVTWTTALAAATDVWVILSDTPCASSGSATFTCTPSRSISASAAAGATSVTVLFDQIHTGSYNAVALLDISGGFSVTLAPEPGDGVSNPSASIVVPASGEGTATLPIVFYVP
jgi:hypothetical protein